MNKIFLNKYSANLLILLIIIFGSYLCLIGGYGSDEDTLPMIYVFEARLFDGRLVSSRFTSYPIPEIGIGFCLIFWKFRSKPYNIFFSFNKFIFNLFFISKKFDLNKFKIFLILSLSSPVLFFENLEPMDYSWAFLFSLGTFFILEKFLK